MLPPAIGNLTQRLQFRADLAIAPNPLRKKAFSYAEYTNWTNKSPAFTYGDYKRFRKEPWPYVVTDSVSGTTYCL